MTKRNILSVPEELIEIKRRMWETIVSENQHLRESDRTTLIKYVNLRYVYDITLEKLSLLIPDGVKHTEAIKLMNATLRAVSDDITKTEIQLGITPKSRKMILDGMDLPDKDDPIETLLEDD